MIDLLVHTGGILIGSALLSVCIVGLLFTGNYGLLWNGLARSWVLCLLPWFFRHQCGIQGVLHYQSNVVMFTAHHLCIQGGGICIERLDYTFNILVVRISTGCGEGLDDKLGCKLIDPLWLHDF